VRCRLKLRGIDSRFFESTLKESSFFTSKLLLKKEECHQKEDCFLKKKNALKKKIAFKKEECF
jgi:hypothetical protein